MKSSVIKIALTSVLVLAMQALLIPPGVAADTSETTMVVGESGRGWVYNAGNEFQGAKGSLSQNVEGDKTINILSYDLAEGGRYVAAIADTEIPEGFTELRVRVRSSKDCALFLRICDSSGQYHQVNLQYNDAENWQVLRLNLNNLRGSQRWGGKNDGRLYFPITKVWFCVGHPTDPVGTVEFTAMTAIQ